MQHVARLRACKLRLRFQETSIREVHLRHVLISWSLPTVTSRRSHVHAQQTHRGAVRCQLAVEEHPKPTDH